MLLDSKDEFRRTLIRRTNLIKFVTDKVAEIEYDNHPMGYCWNDDCTEYKEHYHHAMKEGMLDGISKIEKALKLIKKSIEYSTEKDMKNIKNIKSKH